MVSAIWSYGIAEPSSFEVMGGFAAVFSIAIGVLLIAQYIYTRALRSKGILR